MDKYFSTRRIEALTDGVFAIAMTLLVLDLNVIGAGDIQTSSQLISSLGDNISTISSFLVSFLLLGSMWAVHMRQFEYIKRADRHLTMINTVRLLIVVLIPLTTNLAGAQSDIVLARVLFPINFLALAVVGAWQWNYATSKRKFYDDIPEGVLENARTRNKVILGTAIGVVLLSLWVGEAAFLLFVATPFITKRLGGDIE